ncbi:MAG: FtsX-like permease family protein [Acetobacteraceae bacterium]
MNPWLVARTALRRGWRAACAMALLVALATAMGTGIGALERATRRAAAQAADAFDLVIGAPGGATQLVMTSVYLQPDTVPLLDGAILARVMAEPEAAWASPIGFGDSWHGHPVIGVAPDFVTRAGARTPATGRVFAAEEEAVIGADVKLSLGEKISPTHGLLETPGAHVHSEVAYQVVGRLGPTGTPWDNAILVPIESVWELHGLGNGHPADVERVGPPWEVPSGVPAVVVKPRSFAGAYQLRARYRGDRSTAIFPGEVLVSLFRTLGDVRAVLSTMAVATSVLVVAAVFLAFGALVAARAREHAVLRAIGASPFFIVAALWMELGAILAGAVAVGTGLGCAGAQIAGSMLGRAAGLSVTVSLGWGEIALSLAILVAGLVAATLPALVGLKASPGALLKG